MPTVPNESLTGLALWMAGMSEATSVHLTAQVVGQEQLSRTALAVASLRAVHQLIDEPLVFTDPVALPLLGALAEAALRHDPYTLNDPVSKGLRAAVVVRSRFAEDMLARCVAAGMRQYVVLGAGLDTFAFRHASRADGLRVFEVDHPGTQRWKQRLVADAGVDVPASLSYVALDFKRDQLGEVLQRGGFRVDQPACFSWVGVTMYLTTDAILGILRTVAGFAAGSCLCFDYRMPVSMLNPLERMINDILEQRVSDAGEPWLSSFDPAQLVLQLLESGFTSAESATPENLNLRYFARRSDGLHLGGGVRLMCSTT